jgi:hypothetical protein
MKRSHLSIGTVVLLVVVVLLFQLLRNNPSVATGPAGGPLSAPTQSHVAAQAGSAGQPGPVSAGGSGGGLAYDPALARYLPDPKMTPGDVLDVTPQDFCVSGYSSKVRDVPESVKNEAYQEYGITSHQPGAYEVDHLISLELGGSNSLRNLWPQSYSGEWNAHTKDALENKLHALVCSGSLDMKVAQQAIATNWIAAYEKYVQK